MEVEGVVMPCEAPFRNGLAFFKLLHALPLDASNFSMVERTRRVMPLRLQAPLELVFWASALGSRSSTEPGAVLGPAPLLRDLVLALSSPSPCRGASQSICAAPLPRASQCSSLSSPS